MQNYYVTVKDVTKMKRIIRFLRLQCVDFG